jgi:Zn-dependent peptidase ImmA (M78 family)/DNA-binding XRE family transcriptional regulator
MDTNLIRTIDSRQLGERLKEARKARGLTQEAVASALGILRTTLVAIEKGDRQVTPDEVISMARMFGRSVSEFVSKRANKTPFLPQFRLPPGQHNVEERDLTAAAIELENLARDYLELEEINSTVRRANFPSTYVMEVPGATPEQRGEEVAAEERTRLGLGDGPITDLRSLLEEAVGIRIFYIKLPSRVGGLFACNDELGACIAINAGHPSTRGNWSLAHEYGHFLTTRYQVDVSFTHDHWGKQTAERFADSFAKHFLMPRMGVLRRLSDAVNAHGKGVTVGDVMSLAHLYRVSAEAMFRRLEELKRIPFGTWDGLRQKRGFKPEQARAALGLTYESREPMLPLRYRLLAASAYQNKELLTEGQLAKKLRTDRVSTRLELEAINLMADDAGGPDAGGFSPLGLDASELVKQ